VGVVGHHEADENGSLDEWLAAAPNARPLCGQIGGMVTIGDVSSRPPRVLADGETIEIGKKRIRWHDTPHVPHGWDAGVISELTTRTLFCGDLFTQAGNEHKPVTEQEIVGPSEAMRSGMDYYSNPRAAASVVERLAATEPALLACMHGASFRGDCAEQLRALAKTLAA
jgi:flavorubredoxin